MPSMTGGTVGVSGQANQVESGNGEEKGKGKAVLHE
jgi:hypothetical protein